MRDYSYHTVSSIINAFEKSVDFHFKVSKGAKIRNQHNQVPHLTQDTNGKVTNSQLYTKNDEFHQENGKCSKISNTSCQPKGPNIDQTASEEAV